MKVRNSAGVMILLAIGLLANRVSASPAFYVYGSKTVDEDGVVTQTCEFKLLNSAPSTPYAMEFAYDANGKPDNTTVNYSPQAGWRKRLDHVVGLDGATLVEDFRDACAASLADAASPSGLWDSSLDLHTRFGRILQVKTK
jgi:hypothetical protein